MWPALGQMGGFVEAMAVLVAFGIYSGFSQMGCCCGGGSSGSGSSSGGGGCGSSRGGGGDGGGDGGGCWPGGVEDVSVGGGYFYVLSSAT